MKLETFFEKFDLFADAPDAVTKMRELVLELAANGRLLPEALDRLVEDDIKLMGSIVELVMGQAPAGNECNTEGQGTVFVKVGEFGPLYPREEVWTTNPLKFAKKGDVLICVVGATVGKLNLAIDCAIGRSVAAIRPSEALDTKFLYYSLAPYTLRLRRNSRGSAQGVIGKAELNAISMWVPSREVQKRVVAKVDELMALCDRLEVQQQVRETRHAALARASLARFADAPTSANLNFLFHPSYTISPADLRKSILALAVQGKLVPQDANDEPVEELLKRCFAERRKLKRTIDNEVRSLSTDNALGYEIPESWRWQRLDDLLIFGPTNGFSPKSVDFETPVRSLSLSATTSGRFKGEHSKFIAAEVPEDSDLWLRDGDILVQRGNTIEYVGVAAIYRGKPNCFVYPDLMMKLRVSSAIDVDYIHLAMSHEAARDFLRARASGTSGTMPKINQTTLKSLSLPIPPLAEQRRIVAKVEQLMALVDELEVQLTTSRATAANLLSALVAALTGIPEGRIAAPALAKHIAPAPPPKAQEAPVASVKPARPESASCHRSLAILRKAAGLNQSAVAEAMGLNQAYISQMETGKRPITEGQYRKLLKIFGMIADEVPR